MEKGFSATFRDKFGGQDQLKEQNKTVGEVATLKNQNRYIM